MKKNIFLFTIACLMFFAQHLFAQGGGDCTTAAATQITLPFNMGGMSNCGDNNFTDLNTTLCDSSTYVSGEDKLYAFTPATSGIVSISINSSFTNSSIFLFDGCPLSTICLTGRIGTALYKRIAYRVTAGVTYYVLVSSKSTGSPNCLNNYTLNVSAPQLGGLDCAGAAAYQVTLPFSQNLMSNCGGNNFSSGNVSSSSSCGSLTYIAGDDRLYAFTPTVTGITTITMSAPATGNIGMFLYDGCPAGGICVASRIGSATSQTMVVTLLKDKTYFLLISSSATIPCHHLFTLDISAPVEPGGITCAAALANVTTLPINLSGLSNCGANNFTTANISHCGSVGVTAYNYVGGQDRIYAFTVPSTTPVTTSTITINFSSNSGRVGLFLHSNCPTVAGSCVKAQYGAQGNQSFVATVNTGGTYYLVVSSWPNVTAPTYQCHDEFALSIAQSPPGQPNTQDCLGAIDVCAAVTEQGQYYAGTGNVPNEINSGNSCLGSGEKNDVWYRFTALTSGTLNFSITPNVLADDYDWAVYNLTNNSCADIAGNPALEVSCNYSGASGVTGANNGGGTQNEPAFNIQAGETYVLNVSQFSVSQNGFNLNFGASTAQIFDNSPPFISSVTGPFNCGVSTIKANFSEPVRCYSLKTSDYQVIGPGGPYYITTIGNPTNCLQADSKTQVANVTFSPPATTPGTYTINVLPGAFADKCGNLNVSSYTQTFVVNPINANFVIDSISCFNSDDGSISVNPSGGVGTYSYVWTTTPPKITRTISGLEPGTYSVTVKSSLGCITTKTAVLFEPDSVPAPIIGQSVYNFCFNTPATELTATGLDLEWTLPLPSGTLTYTTPGPTPITSTTGFYTYSVTQAINGCRSVATYTAVNVYGYDRPYYNYAPSYCLTGVTPVANFAPNATLIGAFTSSPSGLTFSNASNGTIDLNNTIAGTYAITYTTAGGCPADSTVTVSIIKPKDPTFTYPISYFCPGGVTTTKIIPTAVDLGTFSSSPSGIVFVNNTTGEIDLEKSVGSSVPYVITNTIAPVNGCAVETHSFTLLVRELPKVDFTAEKMGGCDPFTAVFKSNVVEDGDYYWSFGDGDSSRLANPEHLYLTPGDYKVGLAFGKPGCSNKAEKMVNSYQIPVADFSTYPEPGVVGTPQTFEDKSLRSTQWFWAFGDADVSNEQTPEHVYLKSGEYEITQIVTSEFGCMDTVSSKLIVENNIGVFFPQSFTPNGDGLNDVFEVKINGINPNPGNFELNIFDRWGARVHTSTDYGNHKWDGSGVESSAVYVVKVKVQDKEGNFYEYKNTITILR